jgi:dTDP-4-dehydrorhamnose reductase
MTSKNLSKKNTKQTNVLILGAGYVGTELYTHSAKEHVNYFLKSRKDLDYANDATLYKFILNNGITHVINCAGFTGRPNVDEGEQKKKLCWELNVKLPLKISNVCKTSGIDYIHISSGCIYSGYEKEFTETDEPNFGLFDNSSYYSKTKHAFETLNEYGCTIRVRMPFGNDLHERSYLTKILKYDNLVNYKNSKTYIPNLCNFIEYIVENNISTNSIGVINFVNPEAQNTEFATEIMKAYGFENKNWKFVDIEDINIIAPRSNCVLSIDKLRTMFPDFDIQTEGSAMDMALINTKL